jgi:hypothetical protein
MGGDDFRRGINGDEVTDIRRRLLLRVLDGTGLAGDTLRRTSAGAACARLYLHGWAFTRRLSRLYYRSDNCAGYQRFDQASKEPAPCERQWDGHVTVGAEAH